MPPAPAPPVPPTNQTEISYTLLPAETALFTILNLNIVNHKSLIYDLTVQREALDRQIQDANDQRTLAERQSGGALAMLAASHQLTSPQLSSDFTRLTGIPANPPTTSPAKAVE